MSLDFTFPLTDPSEHNEMRKLTHKEIVERQTLRKCAPKLPFTVVLNNIRSLYNVGSIFRTADGAGVEKIYLCGITGHPPNSRIAKTALGAEQEVPWEYHEDPVEILEEMKAQGYEIVCLEQTTQSRPYYEFSPQRPVCLVLGNEIEGICRELVSYCQTPVEIEMAGIKNSLNVSVAFGIIAYHFRNCLKSEGQALCQKKF